MVELSYLGADGCPLFAWSTAPLAGVGGEHPVLVMLHGGGPDHRSLRPLVRQLSSEAVVILPDVRL